MRSLVTVVSALVALHAAAHAQRAAAVAEDNLRKPLGSYALFGLGPGSGGIQIVDGASGPEIYLNGSDIWTPFWHALRYDPDHHGYADRYVSAAIGCEDYGCGLRRLVRGDVLAREGTEVALLHDEFLDDKGLIEIVDEASGLPLLEFELQGELMDGTAADLDGDGLLELLFLIEDGLDNRLEITSGDGTSLLQHPVAQSVYGNHVIVAQLDGDPAPEIATSFGLILDGASFEPEWDAGVAGWYVAAGQLDTDRPQELVIAQSFGTVWAFDIDLQEERWAFDHFNASALRLADLDEDGLDEVLVGDGQFGGITIYDGDSLVEEGFVQNPDHGITDIQVGDVDQDGELEIVWGSGSASTGTDEFFVSDATTQGVEWRAPTLGGPMVGPGHGDVDGDGRAEIVVAGTRGRFGFQTGPLLVFLDEESLAPLATPQLFSNATAEIHDVVLSDVDEDGDDEVVVAGRDFSGFVRIYDIGAGFVPSQRMAASADSGASFRYVQIADADGDGVREVLAASGGESTGSQGNRVYAFHPDTGVQLRRSASLGGTFDGLETIAVADLDADGVQEVAALLYRGEVGVFDGRTLATEAILPGSFTALALANDGLLLGTLDGEVRLVSYDGASFTTLYSRDLGERAVTGLSLRPRGNLLVASDGELGLWGRGLVKRLWHTENYGPGTGRRVLSLVPNKTLLTCGKFAVFTFAER